MLGRLAVLIVATFVVCMAMMFAVTGGGADVAFGLVIVAGPETLRFDSLQELDLFVKTQLGTYELFSVWDVDPDPTGRYALVK